MKVFFGLIPALILFSCTPNNFDKERLTFTLQPASLVAQAGFKEMPLYGTDKIFFVGDSVFLRNDHIRSAEVIDWEHQPKVKVKLTDEGRLLFADFTQRHMGKQAALLVDQKLVSAPRVNATIDEGILIIVGFFNHAEALSIAAGIVPGN